MPRKAKLFYRIAAILFLLFAAGHTVGFLTFRPPTADALAVLEEMKGVRFDFGGSSTTWHGFYTGFGLFASAYLLFSMFLAWRLSYATAAEASLARTVAWMLFAVQIANIVLCFSYFGPVQAVFAIACAVTVGLAAAQTRAG